MLAIYNHQCCPEVNNGTIWDYWAQLQYNQDTDTYTCPQGETLNISSWLRKPKIETAIILKKYRTQNAKHVL
jgi:hypothetical protein